MLQSTGKLGREDITASMSDRLQSNDGDVVYRFCPGNEGYQLITYHIFEENITKVRIFKRDTEEYSPEVFEWDNQRYR